MLQIKIGGDWLRRLHVRAKWAGLTVIERHPGGCYEASWTMALPPGLRLPALRRGARVEVWWGALRLWSGELEEPDWATQSFRAVGLSGLAAEIPAFTLDGPSYVTTTIPNAAVDTAIAAGWWGVTRPVSVGATALVDGDETAGPNNLAALLTASADAQGLGWGVDEDARIFMRGPSTTPDWLLTPGAAEMGRVDDEFASHVFLRFSNADDGGANATATASASAAVVDRFGFKAYTESLVDRGPMPAADAAAIAQATLDAGRGQLGWANPVTATRTNLLTPGGVPGCFAMVRAGHMIRLQGLTDAMADLGGATHLDLVVAEKRWTENASSITLAPLGYARRMTLAGAFEEIAAKAGYAPLSS